MELLLLIIMYSLDVFRYLLINRIFFCLETRRKWLYVLNCVMLLLACIVFENDVTLYYALSYLIVLITSVFVFKGDKKVYKVVLAFAAFSFADTILGIQFEIASAYAKAVKSIVEMICVIGILCILMFVKRSIIINKKKLLNSIKGIYEVVSIFFVALMGLVFNGLFLYRRYIVDEEAMKFVEDLSFIAVVSSFVLFLFIVYIKNVNEKMEQDIEKEQELKILQERYYEMLLSKEEETRRYRHDMNNHFACIGELAKCERAKRTLEYISTLQTDFKSIVSKQYSTGNKVFDMLLNSYLSELSDVDVTVTGGFIRSVEINDVDMCTIFANLIKNAVEEMERCEGIDKYISVLIQQGQQFTRVTIKNSSKLSERGKNTYKVTSKSDKRNHGFGMRNVKSTVEKYGGMVDIKSTDDEFCVEVTLGKLE